MGYVLGIDVGTTRTVAAVGRPAAQPRETEVVDLGDRAGSMPSVLLAGDDGSVLVGAAAELRAGADPEHVVREFTGRIGDPTPIVVAGRPWAPEELTTRLVRSVVDLVAEREGAPAAGVVLAHPASWGAHRTDRLGAALAAHGVDVSFVAAPLAAARHLVALDRWPESGDGSTLAVYDLGGSTFDAAVVRRTRPDGPAGPFGFALLARPEGLDRLGGGDVDDLVFQHVRAGLPDAFDGLDEDDPAASAAVTAVRRECVEAKEALSRTTEVSVPVLTPAGHGSVRLRRDEFDDLIRPRVAQTVEALQRAVTSAGADGDRLAAVLLVGGSSRIPLVAALVAEGLSRPVVGDADPEHAVARGAALTATAPLRATGAEEVAARVPAPRSGGSSARRPAGSGAGPAGAGPAGVGPAGVGTTAAGGSGGPSGATSAPLRTAGPERGVGRPRPGRSPDVLVTLGGVAAAAAVVATLFLWPDPQPVEVGVRAPAPTTTEPSSAGATTPAATADATADATSELAVTEEEPPATTRRARPAGPRRSAVPPPVSSAPPAPSTTSGPTSSTTEDPTTTPTESESSEPTTTTSDAPEE